MVQFLVLLQWLNAPFSLPSGFASENCKPLDFYSSSDARNHKDKILKSGVDFTQPNFSGHYLIVPLEFMMETQWLVADCETGKFIKDSLITKHKKPKIQFNLKSSQVVISDEKTDSGITPETHVLLNGAWKWIPESSNASPSPANSKPESFATTCKPLDFSSNDQARSARKSLLTHTPDVQKPNFAGHYLLMKADTLFQDFWLLADCNTGKFHRDSITGKLEFSSESPYIKKYESGKEGKTIFWAESEGQWIFFADSNKITGKTAKALFELLPNPKRDPRLFFESVECSSESCKIIDSKNPHQFDEASRTKLNEILKELGMIKTLKNLRCGQEIRNHECRFEL